MSDNELKPVEPRNDPRYVDEEDVRAKLGASWGDLPMGGWTDDDKDAFRGSVIDRLKADLLPDESATLDEIEENITIWIKETL